MERVVRGNLDKTEAQHTVFPAVHIRQDVITYASDMNIDSSAPCAASLTSYWYPKCHNDKSFVPEKANPNGNVELFFKESAVSIVSERWIGN